eukprot:3562945-Pyramimonas_sp.AAC.1
MGHVLRCVVFEGVIALPSLLAAAVPDRRALWRDRQQPRLARHTPALYDLHLGPSLSYPTEVPWQGARGRLLQVLT